MRIMAAMTGINHIHALHWQPALGRDGDIVTGLDDIAQAIAIVLTTPKGQVPHRPEFGSDLWRYLDRPVNTVRAAVIAETADAIAAHEPRARVRDVTVEAEGARLVVAITWTAALGGEARTTRVGLGPQTAASP